MCGFADVRIGGCAVRIRAGISVRVRIMVRDGVRISNRVRRVKLVNYSVSTALAIATSADPHISLSAFYPWPGSCPVSHGPNYNISLSGCGRNATVKTGPLVFIYIDLCVHWYL